MRIDKILNLKKQSKASLKNPHVNTKELEAKTDEFVYKLYNLTDDEIKIIRGEHECKRYI
ncbi:MAG: hypothetical protein KGZ62_11135 [Sulfurimonas sp.]|nr:hypothetical protein [Sulfurimonas sp.]